MGLNDIFTSINNKVAAVDAIINALQDPNLQYIDQNLTAAQFYTNEVLNWDRVYMMDLLDDVSLAMKYLVISYGQLVDEYDDKISDTRLGVDQAFTTYYDSITRKIQQAIGLTWNEIQESETFVLSEIDAVERGVLETLTTELDWLDVELRGVIDTIKTEQAEENDGLWAEITRAAGEIYDTVTGQITSLVNTVSTWVDELWAYVDTIMTWLEDRFSGFYTQIVDWVSETLTSIRQRITREVNTLMGHIESFYNRAESLVNTAKAWLVSEINRLGETLRGLLNAAIVEVTDLLDNLALLTDWRFAFFNLSLSFPELGFLQVLNREDDTFNRFKPYWQALLARVMEEE